MTKYAIKIHFDEDTWHYMSEGPFENMRVVTFPSWAAAEDAVSHWNDIYLDKYTVEIVRYKK